MGTSMRKLLAFLICFAAVLAQAQVTPPTLPANTVYGRLNNGPGQAQAIPFNVLGAQLNLTPNIPINSITFTQLLQGAASTTICNPTASTANFQACVIPSCSSASSALIWTPGTGWGCHTIAGSGTINSGSANQLAYYAGAGITLSGLTSCASGVYVTNGSSVPSCATTLPNIALGTPTSITLTNATGFPYATGGTGIVPIANLATGTPNGAKFVRDDGTLATPAGSGTVTATGGSLTANAIVLGAGSTDTKVLTTIVTDGTAQIQLGTNTTTLGSVKMFGNTSGNVTWQPQAVAGTNVVVKAPNANSTLPIYAQQITYAGPSTARTVTYPDSAFTAAALDVADQTLSGGANVTSANLGTKSSGTTTIDCGTSPLQYLTNGGAFTLAAPSNDGSCIVLVTNNGSAGTITFSGFSVGSNTGDAYATTNTNKYSLSIWRINGTSGYRWAAHQ